MNTNDAKTDGMIFPSDKTRVSANDQTTGYLNGKLVAGTNVTLTENNNGSDETLTISATLGPSADEKVKVSSNDTTEGYLNGKLVAGTGISFTENSDGANETLTITSTVTDTNDKAKVSENDTTAGFLNGKLVAGSNVTFTENNDGANETLTIAAAGGVTGFTASQNTSSPNNTVNASRLLVNATSTNADAVIQPKGTGALLAQLPDGAATGGNKRGANAIDLQTIRDNSNEVASGLRAMILGGRRNIASGFDAIAAGNLCTVSGDNALALGYACTATGISSVAIGNRLTASGKDSLAMGMEAVANQVGQAVRAAGRFASNGDCQLENYVLRRETTNATQTELSADGSAPVVSTRIAIANDSTYTFSALITARRTDADNESAGYKIEGIVDNNAGITNFVGAPTVTILAEDISAWNVIVEADNTNDALVFKATGEAGKTIRWGATVTLMKVSG